MEFHGFHNTFGQTWNEKGCTDLRNKVCRETERSLQNKVIETSKSLNSQQLLDPFHTYSTLVFLGDLEEANSNNNIVTSRIPEYPEYLPKSEDDQCITCVVGSCDDLTQPGIPRTSSFFHSDEGFFDILNSDEGFFSDTSLGSLDDPDLLEENPFILPPTDFLASSSTWEPFLDDESTEMAGQHPGVGGWGSLYSSPSSHCERKHSYSEYDYLLSTLSSSSSFYSDIPEGNIPQVENVPQVKLEEPVEASLCNVNAKAEQDSPTPLETPSSSAPALRRSSRKCTRRRRRKPKAGRHSSTSHSHDQLVNFNQSTSLFIPSKPIATGVKPLERIRTGNRKRDRGPKCWEFLARLVVDEASNPSLIAWEDPSRFTFRIKKPHKVAEMWGNRGEKCIKYEHFARGLRYHYGRGGLVDVPEKKMVYAFGKRAIKFINSMYTSQKHNHYNRCTSLIDQGYDSCTSMEDQD